MMSVFLALKYPELVRGVVCMSGRLLPEIAATINKENPKLKEIEMLVVHGTDDKVVPIGNKNKTKQTNTNKHKQLTLHSTPDFARALKETVEKLPVQLNYQEFQGLGHSISRESLHSVKKFLKHSLESYLEKKRKNQEKEL